MIMLNDPHRDSGFEVPACSREDLLRFAATVHKAIGYERETPFPVMKFVEHILPEIYPDYLLEIVEKHNMEDKFGETFPHKHHIRLREDVYLAAADNNPFARSTVMHECSHCMWHDDVPIAMARREAKALPAFRSSEWQANALAGALMMPFEKVVSMSPEEIVAKYNVTITAARKQLDAAKREWQHLEAMRKAFGGSGSFGLY